MANAWCINAYDCNGCLIQTLQNLDSACIGVGVQYTAPNPLDDKRLDYIKYTDKCWCVQCLSAENEILIYATNGVIKNLTLTNDDVNEAIKIKWNDIFWSNRAKTIVRYKTWSYPVSITDGTLAVEETTKNQYSSTPFSLSGVLDETTYYISAFAVDSNGTIIDVQGKQITTNFFVPWYQKLNYIQSTWTQYINTWIASTLNIKTELKLNSQLISESPIFWSNWSLNWNFLMFFENHIRWHSSSAVDVPCSLNTDYIIKTENWKLTVNWTNYTNTASTSVSSYNIFIFSSNNNQWTKDLWKFKLYYMKIYNWSTLVRDFVPAKRKSDSVVWLIDMINKAFYTNSWTWTFNYW